MGTLRFASDWIVYILCFCALRAWLVREIAIRYDLLLYGDCAHDYTNTIKTGRLRLNDHHRRRWRRGASNRKRNRSILCDINYTGLKKVTLHEIIYDEVIAYFKTLKSSFFCRYGLHLVLRKSSIYFNWTILEFFFIIKIAIYCVCLYSFIFCIIKWKKRVPTKLNAFTYSLKYI